MELRTAITEPLQVIFLKSDLLVIDPKMWFDTLKWPNYNVTAYDCYLLDRLKNSKRVVKRTMMFTCDASRLLSLAFFLM